MTTPEAAAAQADRLFALLRPQRLTAVVDIGANPIDGDPPYKGMLARRLCRVTGFEPQTEPRARLQAAASDLETYLPYAIGAGGPATLQVCRAGGMTSLLEPDSHVLSHFPGLPEWGAVMRREAVETVALCDVPGLDTLDFLKMDLQGGERDVLAGGAALLRRAICVQLEVSFIPLYRGQATFGEMDTALRALGFVPHMMAAVNRRMIAPMRGADPLAAFNQLVEADAVYVRDFMAPAAMDDAQLKQLALVAHHVYRSYDLALNAVHHLAARGAIPADAAGRYLAIVQSGG